MVGPDSNSNLSISMEHHHIQNIILRGEQVFHDGSMGMQVPTVTEGPAHVLHTCPKYQLLPPPPLEAQGGHLEFSSMPQKGSKSSRVAAGTERGSPNGEFPGLELPKGCIPPKHQEMLPDQPESLPIQPLK